MLRSPVALVRELPRAVQLLVLGSFVNRVGGFILPFLTLVLSREFHLPSRTVALLVFAYGAGSIVAVIGGGELTDRLGRRRTLLLSLFGGGVLAVLMSLATSVAQFVPLLVLFGFLADLYRPASNTIVGDLLPSADRAVGFAALRMAVNLGYCGGMVIGGLLADWNWRALFLGDGVTTLAFGALVYFAIPETRTTETEAPADGALPAPWRDGVLLRLTAATFASAFVFFCLATVLPLTVTMGLGYPARVYGMLIGVNGLLIALFEVSVVHALAPFRRLRVAALGILLTGIGFGLTGLVSHWTALLLVVIVWTVGEILSIPQLTAFMSDWAPPEARGRYLGLYSATWSVAFAVNPLVCIPLRERLGDAAFWPLMIVVVIPAVFVALRLDRTSDRPELLRGLSAPGPVVAPEPVVVPG